MVEEQKIQHATKIYETTKAALTDKELHFDANDEEQVIKIGIHGDGLPIEITIIVNSGAQALSMYSVLPFTVKSDKMAEMAIATCIANNNVIQGCFDYDISEERMVCKVSNSFIETDLSKELIFIMFMRLVQLVNKYSENMFLLNKGLIDLEKFISMSDDDKKD